jgi:iron(III) transport system substrate-binding protein
MKFSRSPLLLSLLTAGGVLAATACSTAAPPASPTPPPAAKTAPTTAPQAAQASQPTAAAKPTQASQAQPAATASDWQAVVDAAKKEGKLVLSTHAGAGYEKYVEAVKKALPDLNIEATTMKASDFTARVVVEQQNGQYLWDVHQGPVSNIYTVLTPAGGVQPIKPFLDALPADVKDDSKWAGGLGMYTDPKNPVTLITEFSDVGGMYVNREQVPEGLTKLDDLLDEKYRGKIAVYDPTVSNGGSMSLAGLIGLKGDDFLKKMLIEHDARYVATSRQLTEFVAQGRYPIGFGVDATQLSELQKQGVGLKVERNRTIGNYSLAAGLSVLKDAPHPNAAKVYLNWALSKEGQSTWAENSSVDGNSRRLDVPVYHPDSTPDYQHLEKYPVIQGTASGQDTLDRTLAITKSK